MSHSSYSDAGLAVARSWGKTGGISDDVIKCASETTITMWMMAAAVTQLVKLNELLACSSFVGIPRTLRAIAKNTSKPAKRKPAKSKSKTRKKAKK